MRSHTWLDASTTRPTNLDCGLSVGLDVVLSHLDLGFGLKLNGTDSQSNLGPKAELALVEIRTTFEHTLPQFRFSCLC